MPLSSLPVSTTEFVQTEPSAVWEINHQQTGYPVVDVYILADNIVQKILPAAIIYIDEQNVEVQFSTPRAGYAVVAV